MHPAIHWSKSNPFTVEETQDTKWHMPKYDGYYNNKNKQSKADTSYIPAKGSIPLYYTNDTENNKKRKSDTAEKIAERKKKKTHHSVQHNVNKRKIGKNDDVPAKKIKLMSELHLDDTFLDEPKGLIWDGENYSCAYDALFSVLWN